MSVRTSGAAVQPSGGDSPGGSRAEPEDLMPRAIGPFHAQVPGVSLEEATVPAHGDRRALLCAGSGRHYFGVVDSARQDTEHRKLLQRDVLFRFSALLMAHYVSQ